MNGEVIEGRALVVSEPVAPATLFGTQDPVAIIRSASERATALARVVKDRKLTTNISGREHVRVEGWTLLGSLSGVFPVTVWSRATEHGWEARVEARTLNGDVVGAAEAECSRDEPTWKSRPSYALRSMAQTRATSKALRMPLGFIMTLAGLDPTPAEEMESEHRNPAPERVGRTERRAPARPAPVGVAETAAAEIGGVLLASREDVEHLTALVGTVASGLSVDAHDLKEEMLGAVPVRDRTHLASNEVDALEDWLKARLPATADVA